MMLLFAAAAAACEGEGPTLASVPTQAAPTPAASPTPVPTTTKEREESTPASVPTQAAPTPAASPTVPTVTSAPTTGIEFWELDRSSTGQDLVALLTDEEVSCLRNELGASYQTMLEAPLVGEAGELLEAGGIGPSPEVPCLTPEHQTSASISMISVATGGLSAGTRDCILHLLRDAPAIAEAIGQGTEDAFTNGLGPAMLEFIACLTPEEAAALTPPGEAAPNPSDIWCLMQELEDTSSGDRIIAVLSGADSSGEGLTVEESAALGQAVEACGIETEFEFPDPVGTEGNPLADTEWRLVALGNADAPAEVMGGDPTAEFTTATDMTGWTGCNSYGSRYSVRDSELRLDDLTWTEAGCPSQALFRQEQRMQDSLATVERFDVLGEQLILHSEGGQVLVFELFIGP